MDGETPSAAHSLQCDEDDDVEQQHLETNANDENEGGESDDPEGDGYDSDTQVLRIADSAASFIRRCMASGECAKALVVVQQVVEMIEPPSTAYARTVLLLAQILQMTQHFAASIACMLGIYTTMPAPYTTQDGMLLIARLYELSNKPVLAAFWWKKCLQEGAQIAAWERVATRSFESEDYVFALDTYAELFRRYKATKMHFSTAFMHRYLFCALQVKPTTSTDYTLDRQRLAWWLAQIYCKVQRYEAMRFSDVTYYKLRLLYFESFRSIYDAVFAWEDAPARVIAQWWTRFRRLQREKEKLQQDATHETASTSSPPSPASSRKSKKPKALPKTCETATAAQLRDQTLRRAESIRSSHGQSHTSTQMPDPLTSPFPQDRRASPKAVSLKERTIPRRATRTWQKEHADAQCNPTHASPAAIASFNQTEAIEVSSQRPPVPACHQTSVVLHDKWMKVSRFQASHFENSPTKRKLSAVRHLRNTIINDDLPVISTPRDERFDGFGAGTSENRANAEVSHKHRSLLDVYTIPQPRTQEFVESTGRLPGFADLDIHELEEYVRMAHYRARVLIHKHVNVEHLDAERVKPPWLMALEKTIAMVRDLGVQSTSPKMMTTSTASTGGNATHLTHIHSRVLLQLAAILKTYKQDYGDTSFTRQLVSLHSKLGMWKYDQTSALLAALDATKETGIREEKQRNLEFYHVHEGRHNLKERYGT